MAISIPSALNPGANFVSQEDPFSSSKTPCYDPCIPPATIQEVPLKNSLIPKETGNAVLRLMLPAILACGVATGCGPQTPQGGQPPQGPLGSQGPQGTPGPQAAPASQSGLVGQWREVTQGTTVTVTIQANGQYMILMQPPNGGAQSADGGPYQLIAPNTIVLTVTDWSPKTKWMYVPNPTCGVPGVPVPTNPQRDSCRQWQEWTLPEPPGGTDTYVFNGPNSVTMTDEHGSTTYTRVATQ
jgi:hypothetical protein